MDATQLTILYSDKEQQSKAQNLDTPSPRVMRILVPEKHRVM